MGTGGRRVVEGTDQLVHLGGFCRELGRQTESSPAEQIGLVRGERPGVLLIHTGRHARL